MFFESPACQSRLWLLFGCGWMTLQCARSRQNFWVQADVMPSNSWNQAPHMFRYTACGRFKHTCEGQTWADTFFVPYWCIFDCSDFLNNVVWNNRCFRYIFCMICRFVFCSLCWHRLLNVDSFDSCVHRAACTLVATRLTPLGASLVGALRRMIHRFETAIAEIVGKPGRRPRSLLHHLRQTCINLLLICYWFIDLYVTKCLRYVRV